VAAAPGATATLHTRCHHHGCIRLHPTHVRSLAGPRAPLAVHRRWLGSVAEPSLVHSPAAPPLAEAAPVAVSSGESEGWLTQHLLGHRRASGVSGARRVCEQFAARAQWVLLLLLLPSELLAGGES
jgi:hypothetical protein